MSEDGTTSWAELREKEARYNKLSPLEKLLDHRLDLYDRAADCERMGKKTEWFEKQIALIDLEIRESENPGSLD